MKAVRLVAPGKPLEEFELPVPAVGAGDVLIQVKAAGICHSDAHYRAGKSVVNPLPRTLGHEVAGVVASVGEGVKRFKAGDRVCIHYLTSCGECCHCNEGTEQFCDAGDMIGKNRDGGYAEYIVMPSRSVFSLPDEIPFEHGAIMMCSSSTSLHALNKARLKAGETVAVFGIGGLGVSAVQIAMACGSGTVFAVDIKKSKLDFAKSLGAIPVDASAGDPVAEIMKLTGGRGVDVALELIGLPLTMRQSVRCLANKGRTLLVGITDGNLEVNPYKEILGKEVEIIGVSDHLAQEMPLLLNLAVTGKLNLSKAVTKTVPLTAAAINGVLDELENFGDTIRAVVIP